MAARGAEVIATDIRSKALDELEKRAERAGANIAIEQPSPAPLVVVDAPCSGSGRLQRNPALRWGLVDSIHLEVQSELLQAATEFVEPEGTLAYATCSLFRRENNPAVPAGWRIEAERTLWPHTDGTDGFFWRILRRT
jgi:16S rRNA (cytosine967-C5)-methyltransferase